MTSTSTRPPRRCERGTTTLIVAAAAAIAANGLLLAGDLAALRYLLSDGVGLPAVLAWILEHYERIQACFALLTAGLAVSLFGWWFRTRGLLHEHGDPTADAARAMPQP